MIVRRPEQRLIPAMRLDVIDFIGLGGTTNLVTLDAQRIPPQEVLAIHPPPPAITTFDRGAAPRILLRLSERAMRWTQSTA